MKNLGGLVGSVTDVGMNVWNHGILRSIIVDEMQVSYLQIEEINADSKFNCRGLIQPIDVHELAADIKLRGLIQPVTVSEYIETERDKMVEGKPYRLVAGFRRFMAHVINNERQIPCINRGPMREADARIMNISENVKRKDLTLMQEAKALSALEELGVGEHAVAAKIGMSRGWVQVRFMALRLPESIQMEIEAGFVKQSDIRDLYSIFKASGYDAAVSEAKRVKDFKLSGKGSPLRAAKVKPKAAKAARNRSEIFSLQENVFDQLGNSLMTRSLAWAAGEISTNDLEDDIVKEFPKYGRQV